MEHRVTEDAKVKFSENTKPKRKRKIESNTSELTIAKKKLEHQRMDCPAQNV